MESWKGLKWKNSLLVADIGNAQYNYIMTLVVNPHALINSVLGITAEGVNQYNESLIRTRNAVERSYGVWKR